MRTANKQNQMINPINERKNPKSNTKHYSKSPIRQKQANNAQNQYAVIEQAKRDFQQLEKGNYSSSKRPYERHFSRDNYNSKNSKNSDYELSKDELVENRPLAINHINSYVNKKIENNNNRAKNSKEKIQNFSYKLPTRHTLFTAGNSNYIQCIGANDSKKETYSSNPRMQNPIQQNRNRRNTGYVNNIGVKTKEYFANEVDVEIKNFQINTGKNINTSLTCNIKSNRESKNNRRNEKESNLNNLDPNVNSSNFVPNSGAKFNANSTKNKQVNSNNNNKIDSTYVFSENINHKNFNRIKPEEKLTYSKVNVIVPNKANVNYNNLYEFKDNNLKFNSEAEKNKDLNSKIKLLVEKIKEKKSYESENKNNQEAANSKKKQGNLHIIENNNSSSKYDFPLQISPSIRSNQISNVIADLQSKNELLSNQLSTFRQKFIDADHLKNEAILNRKEKNKSKSSHKSFGIAPVSHDKKKSFDNASNKSSRNGSLIKNTNHNNFNNNCNVTNLNLNRNVYFESAEKKGSNEKSLNFYSHDDKNTIASFNKINNSNSNNDKEYFNYLKDEANYYKEDSNNNNNNLSINNYINNHESAVGNIDNKNNISKSKNTSAVPNNLIYESMKIRTTKYLNNNAEGNSNLKNKINNKNFEEAEKMNSIKNLNSNPEMLSSWNALYNNASRAAKSPLKRLQDQLRDKEKEISALELKLQQANSFAGANEKNAKKEERKVESLQKIISEILSKNKADQCTIEKLKEEVGRFGQETDFNFGVVKNKVFKNFKKNEEIVIHKVYSNFKEEDYDDNKGDDCNNDKNNLLQNCFYFVLISDAAQQNFLWVDLTNMFKLSNNNKINKSSNLKKAVAEANIENNELDSEEQKQILLVDAIKHFNELTKKQKNNIKNNNENKNDNKTNNSSSYKNTINSNKNTINNEDSAKSNKSKPKLPAANQNKLKPEKEKKENLKHKNFSIINLPLQNLFKIETEIQTVYSSYLSFESEFNQTKNIFEDEINKKEAIIETLRLDLESLLSDNSNFLSSANALKSELAEKENKLKNLDFQNNEKETNLRNLSSELSELKQKHEKSFENRKALEARISELQAIVIECEVKFANEKKSFEAKEKQMAKKIEEAAKSLKEKDSLVETFTNKIDELEAKYKNSFWKIEFIEKSELQNANYNDTCNNKNNVINNYNVNNAYNNNNNHGFSDEERTSLLAKIHELELMKNSYLDKISILEYIQKNFENEKAQKEKHLDELALKISELQKQLEFSLCENKAKLAKIAEKESATEKALADLNTLISNKENEIASLKKSNKDLEQTLKASFEEISSLSKTLEIRSKSFFNCEKEIKELKKELKDAKLFSEEKANNLTAASKKISDLENQIRFNFEKFDDEKNMLRDELNTKFNNLLTEKSDVLSKYQSLLEEFNKYQQNCEKLKKQNEENLQKAKFENSKLKQNLNEIVIKSQIENKELEDLLIEFNCQVENSAKMQKEFSEAESKLNNLDLVLLKQEELIKKLNLEKEEISKKFEEEKNKNLILRNLDNNDNKNNNIINNNENKNNNEFNNKKSIIKSPNETIAHLNTRILEIKKINIQLEQEIKEKSAKIEAFENEKLLASKKLVEAKEANEKNLALINEKNKKLIADDFAVKDLSRKLKDIELDLKNTEDENLLYKNKLSEMQKNLNYLMENKPNIINSNIESYKNQIAELESEIKTLSEENFKLKEDLENTRNQCERLIDELNENNILKLDSNSTKRADEVNVTLYGNNNIYNTNLNNSSHLNNSNLFLDLNNTNSNINVNSTNALTNSTANNNNNNNYINYNNNNNVLIASSRKEKEKETNNEYMLKIIDYEDKLEKLIFSNSELARKNNSLIIEIKTLNERIYTLENFEEPEINKKLKQMKIHTQSENSSKLLTSQKDLSNVQLENERLQDLIKDYELSINELQNKLESQCNEINKIRDEYEDEISNMKKKDAENFSFFANEKTERNNNNYILNNNNNNNNSFVANNNNINNMTFFDCINGINNNNKTNNENDFRNSNNRFSNEDYFKKLNFEIVEKNKLIEKLTKELNDSYALMGEANKKLEIFEVDYLNKSK